MDLYVLELTKEDPVDHTYVKKMAKEKEMYRISDDVPYQSFSFFLTK